MGFCIFLGVKQKHAKITKKQEGLGSGRSEAWKKKLVPAQHRQQRIRQLGLP